MAAVAYCTSNDIKNVLSEPGVNLRTDDTPPSTLGDVILEASAEIDEYCLTQYDQSDLVGNNWITQRAKVIAAVKLCGRRANGIPASLQARYNTILGRLEMVRLGRLLIPDAPTKAGTVPQLSNVEVQKRPIAHTRVVRSTSTGDPPTDYTQRRTQNDILDYTI